MENVKERRKRNLGCLIYTLIGVGVAMALGVGLSWWENYTYQVLWYGTVVGTGGEAILSPWHEPLEGFIPPGETRVLEIPLTGSERERFLRVEPGTQRCLGLPTLSIEVRLEDPNGNVIAEIPPKDVFKGYGECNYRKQVAFKALISGTYTLRVTPHNWGISGIGLSILEKR